MAKPMAEMMPDFLVIGAPKAGTTSLYHYLCQHPEVFMSPNKEPHFFAFEGAQPNFEGPGDDRAWLNAHSVVTLSDYQQLFAAAQAGQKRGEASTMYLYVKESCDHIRHYIPEVKMIAILRHPVDRAYSHYVHMRRDGREWETNFEQALAKEPERIQKNWSPAMHYRQVGLYYNQIQRYLKTFDSEQIKIYLYDDLVEKPQAIYRDIFEFIGVDPNIEIDTSARYNATSAIRKHKMLHDFLLNPNGVKAALRKVIPAHIRKPLSAKVYRKNATMVQPLSDASRSKLTASFEPEILRLQDLIGRDLSCWLETESSFSQDSKKLAGSVNVSSS